MELESTLIFTGLLSSSRKETFFWTIGRVEKNKVHAGMTTFFGSHEESSKVLFQKIPQGDDYVISFRFYFTFT